MEDSKGGADKAAPVATQDGGKEAKNIGLGVRLTPVDDSDLPVVSNYTALNVSPGMAFIDFGFIEQSALTEVTRAARSGEQKNPTLDGRLECRIAMGLGDLAQLARQIDQVISTANKARNSAQPAKPDPLAFDPAAVIQ